MVLIGRILLHFEMQSSSRTVLDQYVLFCFLLQSRCCSKTKIILGTNLPDPGVVLCSECDAAAGPDKMTSTALRRLAIVSLRSVLSNILKYVLKRLSYGSKGCIEEL